MWLEQKMVVSGLSKLGFFLIPRITPYLFVAKTTHITPRSIIDLISREIDLERYLIHTREISKVQFFKRSGIPESPLRKIRIPPDWLHD
jgi:hypothetical protein